MSEKETKKDQILRGLEYASEKIDPKLKKIREAQTQSNRNVAKEIRRKKWDRTIEIAKSVGVIKAFGGLAVAGVLGAFASKFGQSWIAAVASKFTVEQLLLAIVVLLAVCIWSLNASLTLSTKRKMSDLEDKKFFNIDVFEEENKATSEMLTLIANSQFLFKDAKDFIEKNSSKDEFVQTTLSWEKDKKELVQLVSDGRTQLGELVKSYEQEIAFREKNEAFWSELMLSFEEKHESLLKGELTANQLNFIGGYVLYKLEKEKLVPKFFSGVKRGAAESMYIHSKPIQSFPIIALVKDDDSYWVYDRGRLLLAFEPDESVWVMEIHADGSHAEMLDPNKKRGIMNIQRLYSLVAMLLELLSKEGKL